MNNWVIANTRFNLSPTPENYLYFRWLHFHFCKKENPVITSDLYLSDLANELKHELASFKTTSKKSLILRAMSTFIEKSPSRAEFTAFLDRSQSTLEEAKIFLSKISSVEIPEKRTDLDNIPVRVFIIAAQMHFELNGNAAEFYSLRASTEKLKSFIKMKFNASEFSGRISKNEIRYYDYIKILNGKNNDPEKGQLKPQLKKITESPEMFGNEISKYAAEIFQKLDN